MSKQSGENPRGLTVGLTLICGLSFLIGTPATPSPDVPAPSSPTPFLTTPLSFEANVGQVEAQVHYLSRGPGYGVFLTPTEAVLVMQRPTVPSQADSRAVQPAHPPAPMQEATLRLQFVGNEVRTPQPIGRDQLPGQSHYFLGNDPTTWHTHVPQYAQVIYEDLYPGIDLIYYGRGGQLEYDLVVAPGANPHVIQVQFQGAETITLMPDGSLRLETTVGDVRQHPPDIYQEQDGVKHMIAGSYRLTAPNRVSFDIAAYDTTRPLYIDPVLSYATYFESDGLFSLARDTGGNLYLTGAAIPSTPTTVNAEDNAEPSSHGGFRDAFVTKLDPTGTTVLYSTYLGGSLDDLGRDIAVDATGKASVVGISSSDDYPTASAIQEKNAGSYDVVLARLSPGGDALEYATYLGGSGEDGLERGLALALDAQGNAYITGTTNSKNLPTVKPLQPTFGGEVDAFVAKVENTGQALLFATYLGGAKSDFGGDVAVDGADQAYVVGTTFSTDFSTMNPFQPKLAGESDIFITKLSSDASAYVYSTYLGGTAQDEGRGLAVDASGQVYLTGSTASEDIPIPPNVSQPTPENGSVDALVLKLDAAGSSLVYLTLVGGEGQDQGVGIAVDSNGQAYVTGWTSSKKFPVTDNAVQPSRGRAGRDAFVLKLDAAGTSLLHATYLGGDGDDVGQAITVDDTQTAFIAGTTGSSDLPRTAPLQAAPSGGFVAILSETEGVDLTLTLTSSPDPVELGSPLTYTLTVANDGLLFPAIGVVVTDTLPARFRVTKLLVSQGTCAGEGEHVVCQVGPLVMGSKATIEITGTPLAAPFILTNRASVSSDLPDPDLSNNSMQIRTDVTSLEGGPMADLSLVKKDITDKITIGAPFRYTLTVTNGGPDTAPNVILTETVPPEVSVGTATPSKGTCSGSRELLCRLGSLSVGTKATVTIEVIPTTTKTPASRAQVTSSATDPNPMADLSVTVDGPPPPVKEGEEQTYTITAVNNGPDLAENVMLADDLLTNPVKNFVDAAITKGECKIPEDLNENDPLVVRCEIGILGVKNQEVTTQNDNEGEAILTLKVKLSADPLLQTNVAAVESTTFDPNLENNVVALAVVVEPSNPPEQGGGDSDCFIATAAFGSPLTKEVQILRHFRDRYLLPYHPGQLLVRGYYFSSPPVATLISQHPRLKEAVRVALWPVVWFAHLSLKAPYLAFMVFLGGLIISLSLLYWVIRVWRRRNGSYLWRGPH